MPKDKLPARRIDGEKRGMTIVGMRASFSGPLPPPKILEDYDRVCPGAADRIIKMAEKEQKASHISGVLGTVLGAATFTSTLALIAVAIYHNQPLTAAVIFSLVAVSGWIIKKDKSKNDVK